MRNRFLMGLVIGLMVGFVLGIVTKHLWTLLFIAVAIGILVVASRTARHKFFPPPAAGQ